MTTKKDPNVEKIKLFVTKLMNEEQDLHSKLIADLQKSIGNITQCEDIVSILTNRLEAKMEVLNKIFKRLQGL